MICIHICRANRQNYQIHNGLIIRLYDVHSTYFREYRFSTRNMIPKFPSHYSKLACCILMIQLLEMIQINLQVLKKESFLSQYIINLIIPNLYVYLYIYVSHLVVENGNNIVIYTLCKYNNRRKLYLVQMYEYFFIILICVS